VRSVAAALVVHIAIGHFLGRKEAILAVGAVCCAEAGVRRAVPHEILDAQRRDALSKVLLDVACGWPVHVFHLRADGEPLQPAFRGG